MKPTHLTLTTISASAISTALVVAARYALDRLMPRMFPKRRSR
jgi:hypothetical protein